MTELEVIKKGILLTYQQGKRSTLPRSTTCMYRGDDNCKCTVGHLIDDDFYNKSMEQQSVTSIAVREALEKSLGIELETGLVTELRALQFIHDSMPLGISEKDFRVKYINKLSDRKHAPLIKKALKELKAEKKIK